MLDLVLPRRCLHCNVAFDRSGPRTTRHELSHYLCAQCLRLFDHLELPDQNIVKEGLISITDPSIELKVPYTFEADSVIQSLIHAAKYAGGMPRLARRLGRLATARFDAEENIDILVPVPLHRTRVAIRGFNQSHAIAKGISDRWKLPIAHDRLLSRVKPTKTQATLSHEERVENMLDAFQLGKAGAQAFSGKRLLLIDDVVTTGSTLASAITALDAARPASITILALAAARHA